MEHEFFIEADDFDLSFFQILTLVYHNVLFSSNLQGNLHSCDVPDKKG